MAKIIMYILFSFLSVTILAQDIDSNDYIDDFVKDTTSTLHIGFSIGGFSQTMLYNANKQNNDSISPSPGNPNIGITIGLLVEKDLTQKLWFKTGLNINISKININYKYKGINNNYNFNYPSIEVPIWLQYAFKTKQRGWSWGAGIKPSLDISHAVDFNNRLFEIKKTNLLIGTGPTKRWQLNSGHWVNLSFAFDIGLLNVFKNVDNIYNNSIATGRPWHFQVLLSID